MVTKCQAYPLHVQTHAEPTTTFNISAQRLNKLYTNRLPLLPSILSYFFIVHRIANFFLSSVRRAFFQTISGGTSPQFHQMK